MAKRSFECQVHTWVMKKDKRAIVYKKKNKRRKGIEKEKEDHEGMSEETHS